MAEFNSVNELGVSQKISIVLSQYPTISYKVISHFSQEEQEEILTNLACVPKVNPNVIDDVLQEFLDFYLSNAAALQGGIEVAKAILVDLYGEEIAEQKIKEILSNIEGSPLQSLKKIDSEALINFMRGAHPQIIATLLCYINDATKSASVLSSLDRNTQNLVITGMAAMENGRISDDMLKELERFIEKTFASSMYSKDKKNKIGGIDTIVQVMNSVDMTTEKAIMSTLEEENPQLAEDIKKKMFIFDDFIKLNDRDIQVVLREVTNDDQLALCLKYCDEKIREELQEKFLKNMSKRKADIIRETIAIPRRVKKVELEEARQVVTTIAKQLHEKGEISLGNSGDEYAE